MAVTKFMESGTSATGGFEFWSGSANVTSDTVITRNGNPRSIKCNTSNPAVTSGVRKTAIMADAGRRVSFYVRLDSVTPSANSQLCGMQTAGGVNVLNLNLTTNSLLRMQPVGAVTVEGTKVLEAKRWYRISISYTITSTTIFQIRVYIDGVLDISISSNGTLTGINTADLVLNAASGFGTDFIVNFSDIYVDDGIDLADVGNINVTCKLPAADNTIGWDFLVGSDPGANLRYTAVNQRPISEVTGRRHRIPAWQAHGALATNITTTTLQVIAPSIIENEIMVAIIFGKGNQVVSPPDGTWTSIKEVNNTTGMRTSIFTKRAVTANSGATFNFTKPVDDNQLFAGLISTWAGCRVNATFLDATAASQSVNASSDTVTYATYDPTETIAFLIAIGQYNNDLTTAGAMSGTDPAFSNRIDQETSAGADCSIFGYDGPSSGAATGSRTHSTTSTLDDVNTGVIFGLVVDAQENYTLQAANVGDQNISDGTLVARTAWVWAKASSGSIGNPKIMDNGNETNITLTTASALYTVITDSASYPSNAAGIGMRTGNNADSVFLYECGTIIAYIPRVAAPPPFHRSQRRFRRAA